MMGIKPVVIAIVVQALWRLARTAVKTVWLGLLAVAAAGLVIGGLNELVVLVSAAVLAAIVAAARGHRGAAAASVGATLAAHHAGRARPVTALGAATAVVTAPASGSLWPLFAIFLKIGSVLFGSGYVLLAFLRADFVQRLGWLTERQLLDAVAVGQVTPGPVFTTATFIGYVLGGAPGAAVATIGIFLPAFVFVALSGVLLHRMRQSPTVRAALDGVNVASLALMAVVTAQLARAAIVDWTTLTCAVIAAVLLFRWKVNSAWLVLAGAILGTAARAF
jgi:chromate transporter